MAKLAHTCLEKTSRVLNLAKITMPEGSSLLRREMSLGQQIQPETPSRDTRMFRTINTD